MQIGKKKKLYKVWNRGDMKIDHDIAGDHFEIEPGGYIEVKRRQAVAIKGYRPKDGRNWMIEVEPFKVDTDMPIFTCNVCGSVFPNIGDLNEHLKTHEDRFKDYKENEKKEETPKPKVFSCPMCMIEGKNFVTEKQSDFKKHLLNHKDIDVKKVEQIIKACG